MKLIDKCIESLTGLCNTYNVDKMCFLGSALNSNFNAKSDIDFLVKFKSIELSKYFENYMNFEENLKKLFWRDVDLLEKQTLRNPILIKSINRTKELAYG